ncbi:hypothetical protein FRC05_010071 [Tulasnella sp. 425]|nr:hypothetical protein FRC05_010071 [Tulasnella sp. 425]
MKKLGSRPVEPEAAPEGYFPIIFKHAKRIRELEILYHILIAVGEQTSAIMCQLPLAKLGFRQDFETMSHNQFMIGFTRIWRPERVKDIWVWNMGHLAGKNWPSLRRLSCPVELAKVLVPGLPISSVMINLLDGGKIDDELWAKLAESSPGILTLDILPWRPNLKLGLAATYLSGVRQLRLRAYRFDIDKVAKGASYFPELDVLDLIMGDEKPGAESPGVVEFEGDDSWDPSKWDPNIPKIFVQSMTLRETNVWAYKSFRLRGAREAMCIEEESIQMDISVH